MEMVKTLRHYKFGICGLRNLSALLPLCAMIVVAIPVSVANAQLVSSSRDPDVIGYVADTLPFNFSGNGDSVGSGAFVSNLNGTLRKAVHEFDISDVMPGVLESARITGEVGPNNGLPLGERKHSFSISAGDGVLNTADNVGGGFGVGFINHQAGDRSDYDYEITYAFRSAVLENTGYLKQRVSPSSSNDQGFNVVSLAKLELSLRPTTDDTTVYYQSPVAGGEATATNSGSFFVDQNATDMEVKDRNYSPFEQGRGIVEYDVSSIPATAEILWAVLDVRIAGYQSQNGLGPTMEIVGYGGDGIVAASDVTPSAEWIGSTGQIQNTGVQSWAIDPEFVETILQSGDHLGLLFQPGDNSGFHASIRLADFFGDDAGRPNLAIAYTTSNVLLGDVDLDSAVTFSDIGPFVAVLFSGGFQAEADCDEDGVVGFLDIAPFIAILSGS